MHENQQIFEIVSVSHSTSSHVPKARDEGTRSVLATGFGSPAAREDLRGRYLPEAALRPLPRCRSRMCPIRRSPNAYAGDHRGFLSRWGHGDLRNSLRQRVRTKRALLAERMKCPATKQACQPRPRTFGLALVQCKEIGARRVAMPIWRRRPVNIFVSAAAGPLFREEAMPKYRTAPRNPRVYLN